VDPEPTPDEEVYRLTQSASIHLLGTALGCAVGLLLTALRLPWVAGAVVLGSAGYAIVRLRSRTLVIVTRRRLVVSAALHESSLRLDEVRDARLENDLWSRNLVVEARDGRVLKVRDVQDPAGAIAVIQSLARHASDAAAPRSQATPPRRAAPLPILDAPPPRKLDRKARTKPFDLGFLERRG